MTSRLALLATAWLIIPAQVVAAPLDLPPELDSHTDGRHPVQHLYAKYQTLLDDGWQLDIIFRSQPPGTVAELPIIALRSSHQGPATWFIAGVHGEEPAGPNALAKAIDAIAALGAEQPVVMIPLANPHGYARNWRYLNLPAWSEGAEVQSVGDSSHLLPTPGKPAEPRTGAASSPEAAALTRYILDLQRSYPTRVSIDLHEDNLIDAGYVYSQGVLGTADPLAHTAVEILRESGIAIVDQGQTRFGEPISNGLIGPVTDSSVDELMSAARVIRESKSVPGPAARTVLVFETPARDLPLAERIDAHEALIRRLSDQLSFSADP